MVLWQWMLGVGLGVIATIFTINLSLTYTESQNNRRRQQRKIEDYAQDPKENCPICLETLEILDMKYFVCMHAIHEACYKKLEKSGDLRCPVCRHNL